jgi:hypothetical protein
MVALDARILSSAWRSTTPSTYIIEVCSVTCYVEPLHPLQQLHGQYSRGTLRVSLPYPVVTMT